VTPPDRLVGALVRDGTVLVRAAETSAVCEEARLAHGASPTATAALGRALTGALLLGSLLKGRQSILLQWRGEGVLGPVVAEGRPDLTVRGYAGNPLADMPSRGGKIDVGGAVGGRGNLVVVKDLGLREPYVSTVPLRSGEMGEDLAYYLLVSEQVPSAVGLGVFVSADRSVGAAGGILVQTLPGAPVDLNERLAENMARLGSITGVLRAGEGVEGLLGRALEGIPFRAEELGNPRFLCRCGPDRLDATLAALGPREAGSLIAEQGEIRARCAFCAAEWRKTALEAAWERAGEGTATS
jgi:molecular chaperone Hsp33